MANVVKIERLVKEGEPNPNIGYSPEGLTESLNRFVQPDGENKAPVYYIDSTTHDLMFNKGLYVRCDFTNLPKYGYINDFNASCAEIELTEYGEEVHTDDDVIQSLYNCDMVDGKCVCRDIVGLYIIGENFLAKEKKI